MYKVNDNSSFTTFEVQQCSCFGASPKIDQQFLIKHSNLEMKNPHKLSQTNILNNINLKELSIKSSLKKSLKRQDAVAFYQNHGNRVKNVPPQCQTQIRPNQANNGEFRKFLSPQYRNIIKPQHVPNEIKAVLKIQNQLSQRNLIPVITNEQNNIHRCHERQYTNNINKQVSTSNSMKMLPNTKINFNHRQPNQANIAQQNGKGSANSKLSINLENSSKIELNISQNTNSFNHAKIYHQEVQKSESTKIIKPNNIFTQEAYKSSIKPNVMRSLIEETTREEFLQILETVKSGIDTSKQRVIKGIQEKNLHRKNVDDRLSLKKMDDVEEIRSLPDSEELSDSDKQSVVLGHLNQYGSMVEQRNRHSSTNQDKFSHFSSLNQSSGKLNFKHFDSNNQQNNY